MIVCERYIWAAKRSPIDRMLKREAGWLGRSPCSRNARLEKALVGRAQLGSSQPPLIKR
jgi:hypothetical protein